MASHTCSSVCTPARSSSCWLWTTELIAKLTQAMVEVEGESESESDCVASPGCVSKEFEGGDWAIGGKALYASDVHALAAARQPG